MSVPGNCVSARQLCQCQAAVSVPGNCVSARQLCQYQATVSVPGNCVSARQLCQCQVTVSARQLCQCQATVSVPGNCIGTRQLCRCQAAESLRHMTLSILQWHAEEHGHVVVLEDVHLPLQQKTFLALPAVVRLAAPATRDSVLALRQLSLSRRSIVAKRGGGVTRDFVSTSLKGNNNRGFICHFGQGIEVTFWNNPSMY